MGEALTRQPWEKIKDEAKQYLMRYREFDEWEGPIQSDDPKSHEWTELYEESLVLEVIEVLEPIEPIDKRQFYCLGSYKDILIPALVTMLQHGTRIEGQQTWQTLMILAFSDQEGFSVYDEYSIRLISTVPS
ncbi:MAG: hypothetical protein F6K40_12450 [Okeania sp. SIO3I5]|uniref:hypothetical protein n=1 Tax=Okeania sp. SIO3I5 TaxID=2607805 RepID=UPI0013BC11CD|nr:hypothetical protein [Okeania sp. SIO3I5]NEQ37040.1 hypothetical protein [Okeania sp. SIO3I5]